MFPNIEFYRGFIGDKYTLCKDLPDKYVLQNGDVYRLLGSSTVLEMQTSMPHNLGAVYPMYKIMTLNTPSPLYEKLCIFLSNLHILFDDVHQCSIATTKISYLKSPLIRFFQTTSILDTHLHCYDAH